MKIKTVLRGLALVCGVSIIGICLPGIYVDNKAEKNIVPDGEISDTFDCILVLGCGAPNGVPSQMLTDRLDKAIELYESGAAQKILMSGDHGRVDYDEVNVMKQYAVSRGIPDRDVFMDHAGFSTYESVYRAKEVFCVKKVLIVTQTYHLSRAVYIAEKFGLTVQGVSAVQRVFCKQGYMNAREIFAKAKDVLWCIKKPEPTYLGEQIPISGDGNRTNDK